MTKQPNVAPEASSKLAALENRLARAEQYIQVQSAVLDIAGQQLHYLAKLAGVSPEFEAIKTEGSKRIADLMNPAQPVPDPASAAPTETTQQVEAPETYTDPRAPGIVPGSTSGVPAQGVDSPLTPGATVPTAPYTELVDVTQPVAGTETHVPLDQIKIETDVRIADPMANANNPQGYAFPLTGPFAADGAASVGTTTSPGAQRTMASLRLARLRKNAGLLTGPADEFVVASEIEKNAGLTEPMIEHEIKTLEALAARSAQAGRRPQGGPLPRKAASAGTERRVPSLQTAASVEPAGYGFDADDASDLFMS